MVDTVLTVKENRGLGDGRGKLFRKHFLEVDVVQRAHNMMNICLRKAVEGSSVHQYLSLCTMWSFNVLVVDRSTLA